MEFLVSSLSLRNGANVEHVEILNAAACEGVGKSRTLSKRLAANPVLRLGALRGKNRPEERGSQRETAGEGRWVQRISPRMRDEWLVTTVTTRPQNHVSIQGQAAVSGPAPWHDPIFRSFPASARCRRFKMS
jgi:hypothetical protein